MFRGKDSQILFIGALCVLAVSIPFIIWPPYDDPGVSGPYINHFLCLLAMMISVFGPFAYGAYQVHGKTHAAINSIIISGYYLGLNAILAILLMYATYDYISYRTYWVLTLIQLVIFTVIVFMGRAVAESAQASDSDFNLSKMRRDSVILGLQQLKFSYPAGDDEYRKKITDTCDEIIEELKYFPMTVSSSSGHEPFSRVHRWTHSMREALEAKSDVVPESSTSLTLLREGRSIISELANFKR